MSVPSFHDYYPTPSALSDQVILITGAGDGIGRAVALACAKHGATVILLGKTVDKLEAVYDQIEAMGAPQAAIYPMDLEGATPNDFAQMADAIQSNFGVLHGIVHNAAQLPYLSRLKDHEADDWMEVMQVNLNAPFLLTQACLTLLQAADQASVIFTGDSVAVERQPFWGAYGVSKIGVEALADIWAKELARTAIRVNVVDPGPTLTALRKKVFPGESNLDLQRPEQVTRAYLWLLSLDSQPIHGERIKIQPGV
jgi:NAD(P)-dependent dehydrogenase (short-subunit alcohol dehydrogenase family)